MSESDDILTRIDAALDETPTRDLHELIGQRVSLRAALRAARAEIVRLREERAAAEEQNNRDLVAVRAEALREGKLTDDERDALALTYVEVLNDVWHHQLDILGAAHRIAGFHRSPVTPPSADVREALEQHLREAVRMGIGWPKPDYLDTWIAEQLDVIITEFDVRPHGQSTEPSDAEVEAAWQGWCAAARDPHLTAEANSRNYLRAALSAVARVRSEDPEETR